MKQLFDTVWDSSIKPLLLKRFPASTPDELLKAHAYAYGGCIIQDSGYYPFGSKFFSDLTHYVRSGDFVVNMIRQSQDLNEFAFSLGSLAHFVADTEGHPVAVNRAVPVSYPKLRERYGAVITYANNPSAHIRTELGFDVLQVAHASYAPQAYHDFIGFEVSKQVLERAFHDTYDLELKDVFASVDLALGTYRRTVSSIIPEATKVAWKLNKDELVKTTPGLTARRFQYRLSRASYEKEWGHNYERPGIGARILAFLFLIIPKVGPFKGISIKTPTPETAKMFMQSFILTVDIYRKLLAQVGTDSLVLENRDFDTGQLTRPGEYSLADAAYAKLARKLADRDPATVDAKLRDNVLTFCRNLKAPPGSKHEAKEWSATMAAVQKLGNGVTAH